MTTQKPNKQNPQQPNKQQTTQPHNRPQAAQPHNRPQTTQPQIRPQATQPPNRPQTTQPQTTQPQNRPQNTPLQNWSWDEREDEQPIEFDGDAEEICRGCTVELEYDGTRVAVEVQNNKGNTWTGRITGFPTNEDETNIGNLKVGNTITFEERHIFRCAA